MFLQYFYVILHLLLDSTPRGDLPSMQMISASEAGVSLRKISANAAMQPAILSSSMPWDTRQSVASDGNPCRNMPWDCRRFRCCLPNRRMSVRVIHLLSLPNMTSRSMSSSLCLKFPLPVRRYSGTEDTKSLKCFMMLARGQPKCFFFYIIICKKLYIRKIIRIFAIAKMKAEDNTDIASPLKSAYKIILYER